MTASGQKRIWSTGGRHPLYQPQALNAERRWRGGTKSSAKANHTATIGVWKQATLRGREAVPFSASDLIRLELNLLAMRGARMNDMLTVLKLASDQRIKTRIAACFPLAKIGEAHELLVSSPDVVGRMVVQPWG
jgi:D-arabinose 1-dehydrogenase-like Zn-dependent alcohol dehydrogenase